MVVSTNLKTGFASVDNTVQMDQRKMMKVYHFKPTITKLSSYNYIQDTRTVIVTNEKAPKILQTTEQVSPNFVLTITADKIYLKYADDIPMCEVRVVKDAKLNCTDLEALLPTKIPSSYFSSISQSVPDDALVIGSTLVEVYHNGLAGVVSADRAVYNRTKCIGTWGFDPSSYTPVVEPKNQRAAIAHLVTKHLQGGRQQVFKTTEGIVITASSQASAAEFAESFSKGIYRDDLAKKTFLQYTLPAAQPLASNAEFELVLSPATIDGTGKLKYLDGNNQESTLTISSVAYANAHALLGLAEDIIAGQLKDHVTFVSCKNTILTTMGKNFTRVFQNKLKELNLALADSINGAARTIETYIAGKFPVAGEVTMDVPNYVNIGDADFWGDPGFTELFEQDAAYSFTDVPSVSHSRARVGDDGVMSLDGYDSGTGTMSFTGAKWLKIPTVDAEGNDSFPLAVDETKVDESMNVLKSCMPTILRKAVGKAMANWHDITARSSNRINVGGVYERHRCRIFCKATTIDESGLSAGLSSSCVSGYSLKDLQNYPAYCPQVLAIFKNNKDGSKSLIKKGEAWNSFAASKLASITPNEGEDTSAAADRLMSDFNSYIEHGIFNPDVIITNLGTYSSVALKLRSSSRNKTLYNNYLVTDVSFTNLELDDVLGKVTSVKGDLNFKFNFAPVIAFNARHSISSLSSIMSDIVYNMFASVGGNVSLCGTNFYIPTNTSSYHYGHNNHPSVGSHVPGTADWLQAAPMFVFNVSVPEVNIDLAGDCVSFKNEINSWEDSKAANKFASYIKDKQQANVSTAWAVATAWLQSNMAIFGTLKDQLSMTVWSGDGNQYLSIESAQLFSNLKVGVDFDPNSAVLSLNSILNFEVDKTTGKQLAEGSSEPSYSVSDDSLDTAVASLSGTAAQERPRLKDVWTLSEMPKSLSCKYSPATAGMYLNF